MQKKKRPDFERNFSGWTADRRTCGRTYIHQGKEKCRADNVDDRLLFLAYG